MLELETMRQWLLHSPVFNGALQVDYTEDTPGSAGLFPLGLEERSRHRDLLGNLEIDYRFRCSLVFQLPGRADGTMNAQKVMDFQDWVCTQSAAGQVPCLGDVSHREQVRAEKGQLKEVSRSGVATYTVTLIADFVKVYEQ